MAPKPLLRRIAPFLAWTSLVGRRSLRADAIAGLIGAVVVLPQGVAYATLAGLPPEYGLYCAMVPTVVAALFGSSLHAVSGPTNAVSLMVLAALMPLAEPASARYVTLALTLALLCGVLILAMGVFRLGVLVNFVSDGVIAGFTAGVGVIIVVSQLPVLLGLPTERTSSLADLVLGLAAHLESLHAWSLAAGVVTLLAGVLGRRYLPRVAPILVATVAGTLFALLVNAFLPPLSRIATLGPLPRALPPLSAPDASLRTLGELFGPALAVTILSVTQAMAIVRAVALRSGQHIDTNQELIGQGLGNLAAAFFSGYPTSASVNRCGINFEAGARTPLSAVFSAVFLLLLLLALAPLAALLPLPVIAALLVLAGVGLIDLERMRMYLRTSREEAAVVGVTFLAALAIPLVYAILIGVIVSFVVYLRRTSRPHMRTLVPNRALPRRSFEAPADGLGQCPQLRIVSVEGSIYFGAVDHVETHLDTLRQIAPEQTHLLIVARNINFIDLAGAEALAREARKRRAGGGRLYLCDLRQPVEDVLRNSGLMADIGEENAFAGKREAIAEIFRRLNPEVCARCTARIFNECGPSPQRGGKA